MRSNSCVNVRADGLPASFPKSQEKIGNDQPVLNFGLPAENDDALVRNAISRAIRNCPKSREQIADEMSEILGVRVTYRMLNDFSAESKAQVRWPAAWDRAFCSVTGDTELLICRVRAAGLTVITEVERDLLELGREYLRRKRAHQATERLERRLQEVDL